MLSLTSRGPAHEGPHPCWPRPRQQANPSPPHARSWARSKSRARRQVDTSRTTSRGSRCVSASTPFAHTTIGPSGGSKAQKRGTEVLRRNDPQQQVGFARDDRDEPQVHPEGDTPVADCFPDWLRSLQRRPRSVPPVRHDAQRASPEAPARFPMRPRRSPRPYSSANLITAVPAPISRSPSPLQDRGGDRLRLIFKLVWWIDHNQTASIEPIHVRRVTEVKLHRDNISYKPQ